MFQRKNKVGEAILCQTHTAEEMCVLVVFIKLRPITVISEKVFRERARVLLDAIQTFNLKALAVYEPELHFPNIMTNKVKEFLASLPILIRYYHCFSKM